MSDDQKTFTQADIDAAVAKANEKHDDDVSGLKKKVDELISANKELKKGQEIKPEDLQRAEDRAEKAENDLAEARKALKTITGERDKAVKALETEQIAARTYALDAEINGATAAGNVVPGLVPGFTAMMMKGASVEVVDGRYVAKIGDMTVGEHIKTFLDSDDGKAWRAAPANGGGGAPGGSNGAPPAKTIKESEFGALSPKERAAKMAEGFVLAADAA